VALSRRELYGKCVGNTAATRKPLTRREEKTIACCRGRGKKHVRGQRNATVQGGHKGDKNRVMTVFHGRASKKEKKRKKGEYCRDEGKTLGKKKLGLLNGRKRGKGGTTKTKGPR